MLKMIVTAAALAIASSAVAQDLPVAPKAATVTAFQLFDRYCLSTDGAIDSAAALADDDGWTEGAPELAEALGLAEPFEIRQGPPLVADGDPTTLVIASAPQQGLTFLTCLVLTGATLDDETVVPLLAQRLNLKARQHGASNVWTYSGDGPYVDEGDIFGSPAVVDVAQERTIRGVAVAEVFGVRALTFMRFGK